MKHRFARWMSLATVLVAGAVAWVPINQPPWPAGTVTLQLQLGSSPVYSDGTTPSGAALEALRQWNPAMGRLQLNGLPNASTAAAPRNGVNNVIFSTTVYGQPFDPGIVAYTVIFNSGGVRSEADVVVNQRTTWDSYRGFSASGAADLRRVLIHEFGHVIGLDHPDLLGEQVSAIMNSFVASAEVPTSDDLNGAAALYGLGVGLPNPIPPALSPSAVNDTTLDEGDPLVFDVSRFPQGSAPMIFQWTRNGVPIAGANRGRLEIPRVTPADAGTYTITITNAAGSATRSAVVRVLPDSAPEILPTRNPTVFTHNPGDNRDLELEFTGIGPTTFVWRRDGVVIAEQANQSGSRRGSAPRATLSLRNLRLEDAGNYTLTILNRLGSATSPPFRLMVRPPEAPAFTFQPRSRAVTLGQEITIALGVAGSPPLSYQWRKDGVAIPGQIGSEFFLRGIREADLGSYTCVVSNPQGTAESRPARLTLAPQPALRIRQQPTGRRLLFSGTTLFSVGAVGTPPLSYQWFKNGVALPGQTTSRLEMGFFTPADLGAFTVAVTDLSGRILSEPAVATFDPGARLAPWIQASPAPLTVGVGQPAEFTAFVRFDPTPTTYQWRKDGVPLAGRTAKQLRIDSVQFADAGDYTLTATSPGGTSLSKPARLTVSTTASSRVERNPSDFEGNEGEFAELSIGIAPGAARSVRWIRDGELTGHSGEAIGFFPARASDSGSYRAAVTLATGAVIFTEAAALKIAPLARPFFLGQLPNQSLVPGETCVALAELADDRVGAVQWRRNGLALAGQTNARLTINSVRTEDAGTYSVVAANAAGSTASNEWTLAVNRGSPPVILTQPAVISTAAGNATGFSVDVRPDTALSYQWRKDGSTLPGATEAFLRLFATASSVGRYSVLVSNPSASVVSEEAELSLLHGTAEPVFLRQPASQRVAFGTSVAFSAFASGGTAPSYQWHKDGSELAGATSATLGLDAADSSAAGNYFVVAANSLGRSTSASANLTVDPAGRITNLSARALTRGGDDTLITGFVVGGTTAKRLLVRAIGPTLTTLGLGSALADPRLAIVDSSGRQRLAVDNWNDAPNSTNGVIATTARVGGFALPEGSRDAALIISLDPGAYTAHLTSAALAGPRVGLVEIYDTETGAPRLINLSTRARVEAGEGALIAGFVVDAGAPKRVLIRGIGPALAAFGVADVLADPKVEIIRSGEATPVAANDNWGDDNATALQAAFTAVGAFALPAGGRDAALLTTLSPGAYTAKVSGANNSTGVALVEIYEVP